MTSARLKKLAEQGKANYREQFHLKHKSIKSHHHRIRNQTGDLCPTCHSSSRTTGVVRRGGRAYSGVYRLPNKWPTYTLSRGWLSQYPGRYITIRYCPNNEFHGSLR